MTPYNYEIRECDIMKKILMTIPVGICYSHNRVIFWANEFCVKILGYPFDEVIGQNSRMFYDSDEEFERVGKALYSEKSGVITTVTRKDGSHKRVVIQKKKRFPEGRHSSVLLYLVPVSAL